MKDFNPDNNKFEVSKISYAKISLKIDKSEHILSMQQCIALKSELYNAIGECKDEIKGLEYGHIDKKDRT